MSALIWFLYKILWFLHTKFLWFLHLYSTLSYSVKLIWKEQKSIPKQTLFSYCPSPDAQTCVITDQASEFVSGIFMATFFELVSSPLPSPLTCMNITEYIISCYIRDLRADISYSKIDSLLKVSIITRPVLLYNFIRKCTNIYVNSLLSSSYWLKLLQLWICLTKQWFSPSRVKK